MKRFYVDEIPPELRLSVSGPLQYSIFDTEYDELAGTLEVISYGSQYRLRLESGVDNEYPNLLAALHSISDSDEFDLPDYLFEIITKDRKN
jgi:hypothetical protein